MFFLTVYVRYKSYDISLKCFILFRNNDRLRGYFWKMNEMESGFLVIFRSQLAQLRKN